MQRQKLYRQAWRCNTKSSCCSIQYMVVCSTVQYQLMCSHAVTCKQANMAHQQTSCTMKRKSYCSLVTYRCNKELLELFLLKCEGNVPDAEARSRDTEVWAAQLGVLLFSCTFALAPVCCRHAVPGCRPLLYGAFLSLHRAHF